MVANKSAPKPCLLATDGQQISQLDLTTIVAQMVDKLVELVHAKHEWPINLPRNYQPWKDENLCVSILGLVHKSEI